MYCPVSSVLAVKKWGKRTSKVLWRRQLDAGNLPALASLHAKDVDDLAHEDSTSLYDALAHFSMLGANEGDLRAQVGGRQPRSLGSLECVLPFTHIGTGHTVAC